MHIVTRKRLREFAQSHPDAETPLNVWYRIVKSKRYTTPNELKADVSSVSFLGNHVAVFNIGSGKYRLVVTMRYRTNKVFIRAVLTHKQYDERTKAGTL